MTTQAHRINIKAGQQAVFEALSTAGGWSRWFTPDVTGDFTEGSEIVCRLNGRRPPARHAADTRGGPGRVQHVLGNPPRPASRVLPDA